MRTPKPFQNIGIDFLAPKPAAILGDDTGLGKTLQLIRAAERAGHKRVLVVCPAIGRVSWAMQLEECQTRALPYFLYPDQTAGVIPAGPLFLVVTYEWLSDRKQARRFVEALREAEPFDVMIADECHYLKTPGSNRTKAVYGARLDVHNAVGERCKTRWLASATLTPNHAGELYPHLKAVLPDVLRSLFRGQLPTQNEFEARYCKRENTLYGVKIVGNNRNTIPELRAALKPYLLVRRKEDVLADLEPIRPVLLPLEVDKPKLGQPQVHPIDAMLDRALDRVEQAGVFEGEEPETDMLRSLAKADDHISSRRKELGLLKVKPATIWIRDFLSSGKKLVVFAHHTDVINYLLEADELAPFGLVSIHGGTPEAQKRKNVEAFQDDPSTRLFVGQILAASTSITLTAASDVLLLEPDWTPTNNYQAISRCHRIGQAGSVTAYFASARGTIDDRIARVLRRKAEDTAQLFGGPLRGIVHTPSKQA